MNEYSKYILVKLLVVALGCEYRSDSMKPVSEKYKKKV
jgi:hypothetical protein